MSLRLSPVAGRLGARCASALLAALSVALPAGAQEAHDPVASEALFDQARQLMEAGRYAEACPKLEASQKLDPGVGTLLNLGDCLERMGRTASAWERFREAAAAAVAGAQPEREDIARRRAASIEPKLCRLVLRVPPEASVPGLALERDHVAFDRALWNEALPVDPGDHEVSATAPGKKPWSEPLHLESTSCAGATRSVEIPSLEDAPAPPPVVVLPKEPPRMTRWGLQRELSLVGAGVGVLLLAATVGLSIDASSTYSDAKSQCHSRCPPGATQGGVDAGRLADFATAALVAAGVVVVGSGVLFFTAPERPVTIAPGVLSGGASLVVRGELW